MWGREKQDGAVTPLAVLVEERFARTVGQLVDRLAADGIAIDVDSSGRLAVAESVAEALRVERAAAELKAAEEAAEAERLASERRAEESRRREERREAVKARKARQAEIHERQRRLEAVTGMNMVQLEQELRRTIIGAPDTGMSLAGRASEEERTITLDEVERWVIRTYGAEILEGADA